MSSVECLREFVNERLTAAAEEIFRVFKQTIVEYEEEIDRQRRLLDIIWKPDVTLHRIELPQQHVCGEKEEEEEEEEEVLADQQFCSQERNSSLDQEEPEPPQIKEEEEELCTSQEGEQLLLKQETDAFMFSSAYDESDHSDDPTLNFNPDESQSAAEKDSAVDVPVKSFAVSVSHEAEHGDSGSTRDAEPEPKNQQHKSRIQSDNVYNTAVSKIHRNIHTGKRSCKCDICGKYFKFMSTFYAHLRVHTGEKPYSCKMCGKTFRDMSLVKRHMVMHTGVKPYPCDICGRRFSWKSDMTRHIRIHTGERPFICKICGKDFGRSSVLNRHTRIHTGGRNTHRNDQPETPV